jgi:ABC-type polysaccharide/polyol phosphate transport system ATPase subunit
MGESVEEEMGNTHSHNNSSTHTLIGRVASLLEVGTCFHPMPSGHENIHVSGAIQGMSKREIAEVLAVGDFLQLFVSQHK